MSYSGKLESKLEAQRLRKKGFSVGTIQKKLKVSRSSVSIWIRGIKLTKTQLEKLYLNKKTGGLKGSIIASMNKIKKREELTKEIMSASKTEVGRLSKRDRFITGIAMYFAEGNKADKNVAFSNSDPRAINFMVSWFRNYCEVPEKKFRCNLYLHDNLDETHAKKFWSSLTHIPLSQFMKTYIVKNNTKRFRKTKHEYGVFRIIISNVNLQRKIMGWISGIFGI